MQLRVVDNSSTGLRFVLESGIAAADDVRLASAFVSRGGLRMIDAPLSTLASRGGSAEFLVGLDAQGTEPEAVWYLYDLCTKRHNFALYCYVSGTRSSIYHPKLYLLKSGEDGTCSIGSSNLTAGGFARNVEINVVLTGTVEESEVSDLYAAYGQLKFHPDRVIPDEELLHLYEKLAAGERQRERTDARSEMRKSFAEKASTLQRPKAGPHDLVGWLELVYDALPDGPFTNSDLYAKAPQFEQRFPGNKNVRAKIRQQLQVLRDLGLVEHRETGLWQRL